MIHVVPRSFCQSKAHRSLLNVDFEKLGQGHAKDRQYWLAKMGSYVSAADTCAERIGASAEIRLLC